MQDNELSKQGCEETKKNKKDRTQESPLSDENRKIESRDHHLGLLGINNKHKIKKGTQETLRDKNPRNITKCRKKTSNPNLIIHDQLSITVNAKILEAQLAFPTVSNKGVQGSNPPYPNY